MNSYHDMHADGSPTNRPSLSPLLVKSVIMICSWWHQSYLSRPILTFYHCWPWWAVYTFLISAGQKQPERLQLLCPAHPSRKTSFNGRTETHRWNHKTLSSVRFRKEMRTPHANTTLSLERAMDSFAFPAEAAWNQDESPDNAGRSPWILCTSCTQPLSQQLWIWNQ